MGNEMARVPFFKGNGQSNTSHGKQQESQRKTHDKSLGKDGRRLLQSCHTWKIWTRPHFQRNNFHSVLRGLDELIHLLHLIYREAGPCRNQSIKKPDHFVLIAPARPASIVASPAHPVP